MNTTKKRPSRKDKAVAEAAEYFTKLNNTLRLLSFNNNSMNEQLSALQIQLNSITHRVLELEQKPQATPNKVWTKFCDKMPERWPVWVKISYGSAFQLEPRTGKTDLLDEWAYP